MVQADVVEVPDFSTSLRNDAFSDPDQPPFVEDANGRQLVHVMSLRDVSYVLENPSCEFSRSIGVAMPDPHPTFSALWAQDHFPFDGMPGRHVELRSIVESWFRTKAVRILGPYIRDTVYELLVGIVAKGTGEVDIAREFAYELSIRVICRLIGWEPGDTAWWRQVLDTHVQSVGFDQIPRQYEIDAEVLRKIEERRAHPRDELIDVLIRALDKGLLDERDIIAFVWMFVAAGTDTTAIAITNTFGLLDGYSHLGYIRDNLHDEQLLKRCIEEVLRFGYNFSCTMVRCIRPTKLGDIYVKPGDAVLAWYSAANRDRQINGGNANAAPPALFDPVRSPNRHLAFGSRGGAHYCLGAALARFEVREAFQSALPILEGLRGDPHKPLLRTAGITDGFNAAPFVFDQAAAERQLDQAK